MRTWLMIGVLCLFSFSALAAEPEFFKLSVEKSVIKDGKGSVTIKVHKVEGRKINTEFPTKLTLTPAASIAPAKSEFKRADFATFTETDLVINVPFTITAQGKIDYTLRFGTCEVEKGEVKSCVPHTHTDKIELKP